MAREYLTIGSSPTAEECAQLGAQNYRDQSRRECTAFIGQLRRTFGQEPTGARIRVKSFSHDFGTYHEVVCEYDDANENAIEYAYKLEGETPDTWDEQARFELGQSVQVMP